MIVSRQETKGMSRIEQCSYCHNLTLFGVKTKVLANKVIYSLNFCVQCYQNSNFVTYHTNLTVLITKYQKTTVFYLLLFIITLTRWHYLYFTIGSTVSLSLLVQSVKLDQNYWISLVQFDRCNFFARRLSLP